ncbi:hypothetical protein AL485_18015 [Serratia liquefaciens]|uniref:hypothetical protein n=1 Tax=Serratia liquefaciens TaxID=614 RepID=UPI00076B4D34|nr:hypothetical protein [Serratia liquefaciens]AMH00908.1 hypothetical protein AL485_18015 [Serratia liquefaciens]
MTQTLTTKQLNAIAAGEFDACSVLDASVSMARELLANREAQPVAWSYEWASYITCEGPQDFKPVIDREAPPQWAIDEGQARNVSPLYTAPPAPAAPDDYCIMPLTLTAANGAKGALSGEFKVSRAVRCHECGGEGCDDGGPTENGVKFCQCCGNPVSLAAAPEGGND